MKRFLLAFALCFAAGSAGAQSGLGNLPANNTVCNPTGSAAEAIACTPAQLGSNLPALTNSMLAQMPANTTKCNNTASLANPVDCTVSQFKAMSGVVLNIQDPAYGAVCNGSTDDAAAIQAAVTATPAGGTLLINTTNCKVNSAILINHPMTLLCSGGKWLVAGNISAGANTVDVFHINSHMVTINGCYINGPGTPSGNTGIAVGTDGTNITDGTCPNGSATFTSAAQANFTSADVGKYIYLNGCASGPGPLFTTISGFTNSTTVTLATTATCGGACPMAGAANATYGVVYLFDSIINSQVVNFNKGVHFIDAAQWRMIDFYTQSNIGVHIENQTNPDYGNGYITSSYILAQDNNAGHYGILWNSGGETYVENTKVLNGQYGVYHNSILGLTGGFTFVGGGIENCGTNAAFFSEAAVFNQVLFSSTYINCGTKNIVFDNAAGSIVNGASIIGVTFGGGGGTAIDAGKVNYLNASGNVVNNGAVNPAINATANCNSCMFSNNTIVGATLTYSNASTTARIDDMIGMTTASLPSAAANGSRIFATDADPATACTHSGAQTGSTAFRQNGAWKCF